MDSAPHQSRISAFIIQRVFAWAACVLVTYILASLFQTGFVLAGLHSAGAKLPITIIVHTALYDLYGLAFNALFVSYLLVIAVGFVIALPIAALLKKWTRSPSMVIYPLAGAVSMAGILILAKIVFYGLTLYAGTRGPAGFAFQVLAGAVGGVVFACIIKEKI